jgi:hypothetical protein
MNIRLATSEDQNHWNAFIHTFPGVPPFCRYEWKFIIEGSYRVDTAFYIAEDDKQNIVGLLPLYFTYSLRKTPQMFCLRYGLLGTTNEVRTRLLHYAYEIAKQKKCAAVTVPAGFELFTDEKPVEKKFTLMMPLMENADATWESMRDKTRNMIRKGERAGLSIDIGTHNVEAFHTIYASYMKNIGVFFHSLRFFRNILIHLKDDVELICAKMGDEVVGGTILLYGKDIAGYPYQAVKVEHRNNAPIQFMNWEMIKRCHVRGSKFLDMGESSQGSPVYQSKLNFGANPYEIFYYTNQTKPKDQSNSADNNTEESSPKKLTPLSVINTIHEKSPLWLAKYISPWLRQTERII